MYHLPFAISLQYTENLLETLTKEFEFDRVELSQAKKLLEFNLPPIVKPQIISYLFGISYSLLLAMSRNPVLYYRRYRIPKRISGFRQIEAPRRFLKLVQKWVYDYILSTKPLPQYIHGFSKKRNIFTNAQEHLNSKNIMILDIKSFFPSIKRKQVFEVFKGFGYSRTTSNRLAGLCTLKSRLPQGAPTSPALANLVFLPTDRILKSVAEEWGCIYTRYADDLVISGNILFKKEHRLRVLKIVEEAGFKCNNEKTRIIGSGGRQIVAGIVTNNKGYPPRYKRMRWRAMFHQASVSPEKYIGKSRQLLGISSFVKQYDASLSEKYKTIAKKIHTLEA